MTVSSLLQINLPFCDSTEKHNNCEACRHWMFFYTSFINMKYIYFIHSPVRCFPIYRCCCCCFFFFYTSFSNIYRKSLQINSVQLYDHTRVYIFVPTTAIWCEWTNWVSGWIFFLACSLAVGAASHKIGDESACMALKRIKVQQLKEHFYNATSKVMILQFFCVLWPANVTSLFYYYKYCYHN